MNFFFDFLFPNRCIHCDLIIDKQEIVCELCMDQIHFTHIQNHTESELHKRCKILFPIENTFSIMKFEENGLSRKIIHQLKYSNYQKIGKKLAEWFVEKNNLTAYDFDLITCIPLHPKKQKKRGYNQLHLFVETLSEKTKIPFEHNILSRIHYKKAQAKLKKEARNQTEKIFSLQKPLVNKKILLVDDVFTTGNTIASAAWEILKNPSNKISILVMAVD